MEAKLLRSVPLRSSTRLSMLDRYYMHRLQDRRRCSRPVKKRLTWPRYTSLKHRFVLKLSRLRLRLRKDDIYSRHRTMQMARAGSRCITSHAQYLHWSQVRSRTLGRRWLTTFGRRWSRTTHGAGWAPEIHDRNSCPSRTSARLGASFSGPICLTRLHTRRDD